MKPFFKRNSYVSGGLKSVLKEDPLYSKGHKSYDESYCLTSVNMSYDQKRSRNLVGNVSLEDLFLIDN